jgi:hypothetical protein
VLSATDIATPKQKDPLVQEIKLLQQEIRQLNNELKFPASVRGAVSGAALGFAVAGIAGALLGGYGGLDLGRSKDLTEQDKQIVINKIRAKSEKLAKLIKEHKARSRKGTETMSATEIAQMDFKVIPFYGEFEELCGQPADPFHCMVFGRPKQGKSIFSFQFARFLSEFGKVLYIASEEGFGGTLKKKIDDYDLADNSNVTFSDARGIEQMRKVIPGNKFVFIDSVNYARLEVEDVENLKKEFRDTSFITIQQATKGGQFRGSQEYAHNCDIIIEVIQGVAYQTGRFQAASEYKVWRSPEEEKKKPEEKKESEQLKIFEL